MHKALLVSDLHLESSRPDITSSFFSFLQSVRGQCDALYILGDLFELWIGDDEESHLSSSVANELSLLQSSGTPIYLMHGNRDFLIGSDFSTQCGAQLIEEPYILELGSQRIVLLHGDVLCSGDTDYMEFRAMVRQQAWQSEFRSRSLEDRQAFAAHAREQSQYATSTKSSEIMDVSPDEVTRLLQKLQLISMIHGHTHRPAVHTLDLPDPIQGVTQAKRVVLGDWDKQGWCGVVTDSGITLEQLPPHT